MIRLNYDATSINAKNTETYFLDHSELIALTRPVYDILGYDINSGDKSYSLIEDCVLRTCHSFSSKR